MHWPLPRSTARVTQRVQPQDSGNTPVRNCRFSAFARPALSTMSRSDPLCGHKVYFAFARQGSRLVCTYPPPTGCTAERGVGAHDNHLGPLQASSRALGAFRPRHVGCGYGRASLHAPNPAIRAAGARAASSWIGATPMTVVPIHNHPRPFSRGPAVTTAPGFGAPRGGTNFSRGDPIHSGKSAGSRGSPRTWVR